MPPLLLLRAAQRFAALRPEERAFAARAWLAAPVVRASLALVGLKSTLRWVDAVPAREAPSPASSGVSVAEGGALVGGAFRTHLALVARGECLPRSMVQYLLHRRDGVPARLVIGVKRPERGAPIEAHAWIEADPTGAEGGFTPLFATRPAGGVA